MPLEKNSTSAMAEMEEKFFQLIICPFKACLNFPFLYVLFEAVFTLSVSVDAFGSVQNPFDFYRPQRSCGKVMFLHLSVILSMAGGLAGRHPLDRHPPGRHPLADRHPPGRQTPPGTATAADDTHPTRMHFCRHYVVADVDTLCECCI